MKKEYPVKVQHSGKRDGGGEHYHINIPTEIAKAYGLDGDSFLLVEPDVGLGFIKLVPAKVVPSRPLSKLIEE